MQRHTIYHVARTIESDSSLATESSLPHTPAVVSLSIKLAVGIHDSLPAAAKLLGLLSQGVAARSSKSAELMDVAASLPDQLDELRHINLLGATGINRVLLSIDHLRGLVGPDQKSHRQSSVESSISAAQCERKQRSWSHDNLVTHIDDAQL